MDKGTLIHVMRMLNDHATTLFFNPLCLRIYPPGGVTMLFDKRIVKLIQIGIVNFGYK